MELSKATYRLWRLTLELSRAAKRRRLGRIVRCQATYRRKHQPASQPRDCGPAHEDGHYSIRFAKAHEAQAEEHRYLEQSQDKNYGTQPAQTEAPHNGQLRQARRDKTNARAPKGKGGNEHS
jgi:hypothetical protein